MEQERYKDFLLNSRHTGIEGSLFLYERSCAPRYAFTVMNRLGVENLTVYCTGDLEISHQGTTFIHSSLGDYVIMKDNADEEITGLWMYEESDRARLASKLASYSQQNHRHQFPASNAPPNQHLEDTPQQQEQQHMAMSQPVSLQQLSALTQQPVGAQQGIHPPPQQHSINGKIDVMGMLQNAVMNTQPHSNIVHQNGIGVGPQQPVAPPQQYPVRNINDIFDRIDMCFMPPHSRDYPLNQHDFSARLNVLLTV